MYGTFPVRSPLRLLPHHTSSSVPPQHRPPFTASAFSGLVPLPRHQDLSGRDRGGWGRRFQSGAEHVWALSTLFRPLGVQRLGKSAMFLTGVVWRLQDWFQTAWILGSSALALFLTFSPPVRVTWSGPEKDMALKQSTRFFDFPNSF